MNPRGAECVWNFHRVLIRQRRVVHVHFSILHPGVECGLTALIRKWQRQLWPLKVCFPCERDWVINSNREIVMASNSFRCANMPEWCWWASLAHSKKNCRVQIMFFVDSQMTICVNVSVNGCFSMLAFWWTGHLSRMNKVWSHYQQWGFKTTRAHISTVRLYSERIMDLNLLNFILKLFGLFWIDKYLYMFVKHENVNDNDKNNQIRLKKLYNLNTLRSEEPFYFKVAITSWTLIL